MKKPTEKLKKLHKTKDLGHLLSDCSSIPIDDLLIPLQQAKEEGYESLYFEAVVRGYEGYLDEIVWRASKYEDETDEEFNARVTKWKEQRQRDKEYAKKQKLRQEERDRKEFERLSKKFAKVKEKNESN